VVAHTITGLSPLPHTLAPEAATAILFATALGGVYGFVISAVFALLRRQDKVGLIVAGCTLFGALGGAASVLAAGLVPAHPLLSSSLAWAGVGFLAGWGGYFLAPGANTKTTAAANWVLGGAVCAGGTWALGMVVGGALLDGPPSNTNVLAREWSRWKLELVAVLALGGTVLGGIVGLVAGLLRKRQRSARATALGVLGAQLGAVGGLLTFPVMVACAGTVHPLLSSSLTWAAVGGLIALMGRSCAPWLTKPEPVSEQEESDAQPRARIEWLLWEEKRPFRDRPLARVLPVLLAAGASLLGAALVAPSSASAALLAVGVLGLMVALVLYRQEERLRALEHPRHDRSGSD
jgi:hypothetical protein